MRRQPEPGRRARIVHFGVVSVEPRTLALADAADAALSVWRRHCGLAPSHPAVQSFNGEQGPHDPRLLAELNRLFETVDPRRTCLIYVHRGHQAHYRTPLLQSLLAGLPRLGAVTSVRADGPSLPSEATDLALAYLEGFENCLIVHDDLKRLRPQGDDAAGGTIEHILLSAEGADPVLGPDIGFAAASDIPGPIGKPYLLETMTGAT